MRWGSPQGGAELMLRELAASGCGIIFPFLFLPEISMIDSSPIIFLYTNKLYSIVSISCNSM
jgi:hypothetical protein